MAQTGYQKILVVCKPMQACVMLIADCILNFAKTPYLCKEITNRGALKNRAEIKPIEPDPGNAGEGNGISFSRRLFPLLASLS